MANSACLLCHGLGAEDSAKGQADTIQRNQIVKGWESGPL